MEDFAKKFNDVFHIVPACTEALVAECQRLRYHIYCIEHSILRRADCRDDIEQDEYDARSAHSLLRHRDSGQTVATVRLIMTHPRHPEWQFPLEEHLGHYVYAQNNGFHRIPRHAIAEISRFAVSKDYRLRLGDRDQPHTLYTDSSEKLSARGNRNHPHITLGLFKAIVRMSYENRIAYWCAAMEPPLIRLLSRFGIHFLPLGPIIEYHGPRQPCSAAVDDVLNGIYAKRPDIWRFITDDGRWHPQVSLATSS